MKADAFVPECAGLLNVPIEYPGTASNLPGKSVMGYYAESPVHYYRRIERVP